MNKVETEDDHLVPSEKYAKEFEPGGLPIAPDGGIAPGFGSESPPVQQGIDESVCRRGPCRHYWHLVTDFPSGNPDSTWTDLGIPKPRQHNHACLVNIGMETDLTEDFVYQCNRWDPITPRESDEISMRRELYYREHPEFAIEHVDLKAMDDEGGDNGTDTAQG
jgi:hypothetical protein